MPDLPATTWGDPTAARRALLIHGLTSSGATWWRVAEALAADGWHVTAVDLRGNGDAPTADRYGFAERVVLLDPALELPTDELGGLLEGELRELALNEAGFRDLRPAWHPLDIEHKATATAKATAHMVERTVADNTPWNVLREARALPVPTLIVGGDHAVYSMLPTATALALVSANALIDYRVVAGSGHSPHRDRPEATLALLREWLG